MKTATETTRWDAAEHLDSSEAMAACIDVAMEDGDPALIAVVLGDVARAIENGLDRRG